MASDGDELVKYITEKVVVYMENPRSSRIRSDNPKQAWTEKWFGMLPLGLSIWRNNLSHKHEEKR